MKDKKPVPLEYICKTCGGNAYKLSSGKVICMDIKCSGDNLHPQYIKALMGD